MEPVSQPDQDGINSMEQELQHQLDEQRHALTDIAAALACDASAELQGMHDELAAAIAELEAALSDIRAADGADLQQVTQPQILHKLLWVHSSTGARNRYHLGRFAGFGTLMVKCTAGVSAKYTKPTPLLASAPQPSEQPPCHMWPFSTLSAQPAASSAILHWQAPSATTIILGLPRLPRSHMLEATAVPLSLISCLMPPTTKLPRAGSHVLAKPPGTRLWEHAQVVSLLPSSVSVAMQRTGKIQDIHPRDVVLADENHGRPQPPSGDEASISTPSEDSEIESSGNEGTSEEGADDDLDNEAMGLGALGHARLAAATGAQDSTVHFAEWESHSRGIASKLLAGMGFVRGQGLGRDGHGIAEPLEVRLLQQRRGLGDGALAAMRRNKSGSVLKRKKRGGERTRLKRYKAAQAMAKQQRHQDAQRQEEEHGAPGLFAFINKNLGDGSEAAAAIRAAQLSEVVAAASVAAAASNGRVTVASASAAVGARRGLMAQQDMTSAIEAKVQHLRAMLGRNKGNKGLAPQIKQRLQEAQAELAAAQAQQAHASKAVLDSEAQKKWLRF